MKRETSLFQISYFNKGLIVQKVKTGQKFSVKAETWNSFIDAADFVKQQQADVNSSAPRRDTKPGVVMLRNNTGSALEQFKVVSVGDLIIKPADNEQEFRNNAPVFEAEKITGNNKDKPFGILQRPLAKSECGFAMVTGITPVKINIGSASHEYAEPDSSGLKSAETGAVRIIWKETGTGTKWAVAQLGASVPGKAGYEGPFAVARSGDTRVTVHSYNSNEGRAWESLIYLGLEKKAISETEITIGNSGFIYVQITLSNGSYSYEIKSGDLPDQENGKLIVPLADIGFESGAISKIIQLQYGNIHFPGRML